MGRTGHLLSLLKIAARNLARHKRRTLLASLAIGVGLAALIFVDALMYGMFENMIHSATATFLGDGQIHAQDFRSTLEIESTIEDREAVVARLASDPHVASFTERTQAYAMITSPANVSSILLLGIDPDRERALSKIDEATTRGDHLRAGDSRRILIGSKLAETLEVDVGDRIVVTAAAAHTGELVQEMFRVAGIFDMSIREMDGGMAFIPIAAMQTLLGLGGDVHEIAVKLRDPDMPVDQAAALWAMYAGNGNEALGWRDLMPELSGMMELSRISIAIVGLILFGVVALGIINTLFMSLYERMFEFGVLRAVGTRPVRMALLILFEAATLSAVSIVVGAALGYAACVLAKWVGIDYTGIEYSGVTFRERIRPVIELRQFIVYPIWVFIFTLIAGLYPAVYAARLTPAKAMRRSL